jgi:hypothetical protein
MLRRSRVAVSARHPVGAANRLVTKKVEKPAEAIPGTPPMPPSPPIPL